MSEPTWESAAAEQAAHAKVSLPGCARCREIQARRAPFRYLVYERVGGRHVRRGAFDFLFWAERMVRLAPCPSDWHVIDDVSGLPPEPPEAFPLPPEDQLPRVVAGQHQSGSGV